MTTQSNKPTQTSYYSSRRTYQEVDLMNNTVEDFNIDFYLLEGIMYQQSPTGSNLEEVKKRYLINLIKEHTDPGNINIYEHKRNIYVTKGTATYYPTVVAHYDTAQDFHSKMKIYRQGNWMFGFDEEEAEQCGIGADDSVGVYFAIEMLKRLDACKVVLFYGEERGCLGSSEADMTFFDNSSIVTQLDRRSYTNDFIKYTNGVQTFNPEHYEMLEPLLEKYNYSLNNGSCTDVGKLRQRGLKVSSHNLSCGYFNEHTNNEVIHIPSMNNAFMFAYELLQKVASLDMPLEFAKETTTKSLNTYYSRYNDLDFGYDDFYKNPFEDTSMDIPSGYDWNSDFGLMTKNGMITSASLRDFFPLYSQKELLEEFGTHKMSKEDALEKVKSGDLDPIFYSAYYKESYSTFQNLEDKLDSDIQECLEGGECPSCGVRSAFLEYLPDYNVILCRDCGSTYYFDFEEVLVENLPLDSACTFYLE